MDRTERLLDLVALLLDASEPVSFAELRELFAEDYGTGTREAAERKLERDKAELLLLGVPLEFVPPDDERELGGYRIDRKAFYLQDLKLTPEESAALYAAGSAALASREFPFAQDLAHALRKIALAGSGSHEGYVGPEASLGSAAARRLLIVRPGDPTRAGKLRALGDAVARRKRVHVAYHAAPAVGPGAGQSVSAGERTERDVDPYGLAFRGGAWRLVGFCHLRAAMRVFVVDRIEDLRVSEARPSQPDFEIPEGFDAGAVAGTRPWQWVGSRPQAVRLRFGPGSELLAERAFDVAAAPDAEGAHLDLQVTFLDGLLPHVLSFGDRVWVESPPHAREKVRGALEFLAARLALPPPPSVFTEEKSSGLDDAADAAADAAAHSPQPTAAAVPPAQSVTPPPRRRGKPAGPGGEAHERLRRLLLVVPAARRKPGIKVDELARELGLDAAELLADIDLLGLVGRPPFSPDDMIDISVDEKSRVFVTLDGSFSRPPQLTPLEALALAAASEAVAPADPAVTSALGKLTASLPVSARALYTALARRLDSAAPPPRGTSPLIAHLRAAAEGRREVVLEYDKEGRGAHEERALQPWAVIDHGGRWYVYGHDLGRSAERTFRVDRVRAVRETGRTFPDPGPLDAALFERKDFFFPTGAERPIALRFSPDAAAWALSRYGARARGLPDGGAEAVIDSAGSAYAVSLALSLAGEAEVIDPPEARAALRDEVLRALARYADRR